MSSTHKNSVWGVTFKRELFRLKAVSVSKAYKMSDIMSTISKRHFLKQQYSA